MEGVWKEPLGPRLSQRRETEQEEPGPGRAEQLHGARTSALVQEAVWLLGGHEDSWWGQLPCRQPCRRAPVMVARHQEAVAAQRRPGCCVGSPGLWQPCGRGAPHLLPPQPPPPEAELAASPLVTVCLHVTDWASPGAGVAPP